MALSNQNEFHEILFDPSQMIEERRYLINHSAGQKTLRRELLDGQGAIIAVQEIDSNGTRYYVH